MRHTTKNHAILQHIKNRKTFKVIYLPSICMVLLSSPVSAGIIDDSSLDLKLRNEYRHADRPSASPNNGIDAWVQGILFDFESGRIANTLGMEANLYRVQKIRADENKSTRWYLDGHESFNLAGVAAVVDLSDWGQIKIGRFGTDSSYSIPHPVPFFSRSLRTPPNQTEGALWSGNFGDLHLYGLYARAKAGGYNTTWVDEQTVFFDEDGALKSKNRPRFILSGQWESGPLTTRLGATHKEGHANEIQGELSYKWQLENKKNLTSDLRIYYGKTTGDLKNHLQQTGFYDDTYLISSQLSYSFDNTKLIASAGHAGNKLNNRITGFDTDLAYSFDQSIDRNHHNMWSWQVGGFQRLSPSLNAGLALTATNGYEDHTENVQIEGVGINLLAMHTMQSGPLKGLKSSVILNKAQEYREGSVLGDKLDYYDIKITFHYDIRLF